MRTWEADQYADEYLSRLNDRIEEVYTEAMKKGLRRINVFFSKLRKLEAERDRLAALGMESEEIERAIRNRITMLMREQNIVAQMAEELQAAGRTIEPEIQAAMAEIYWVNGSAMLDEIGEASGVRFSMPPRRQVEIILSDIMPVFAKIAYNNIKNQASIIRALQNEMAQAAALGESQAKIVKRIMKVTGMSAYQARRTAQTERTRVQSQARYEAGQEAVNAGVRCCAEWHCRFINSRDPHMDRHGIVVIYGDIFPGSVMRYPGDPNGPAEEVINCHCYLTIRVLLDDEDVVDGEIVRRAA